MTEAQTVELMVLAKRMRLTLQPIFEYTVLSDRRRKEVKELMQDYDDFMARVRGERI